MIPTLVRRALIAVRDDTTSARWPGRVPCLTDQRPLRFDGPTDVDDTTEIEMTVNGETFIGRRAASLTLLDWLREEAGLTGAKEGCAEGECGACTVQLDGRPMRACIVPVSAVGKQKITTVEGVESKAAMAVREAWRELDVVQCGYCQSGQMMSATALLESNPSPSDDDINQAMRGNLCRCATYHRIRAAIHRAAESLEA